METIKNLFGWFRRWEYSGLFLLVLIILVLHFSTIMQPNEPLFDEIHYVEDGRLIIDGEGTQRGEHPPLGKLFIVAGMQMFGDNPFGWRFFPVIFGAAGIVFMYLICRRLNLSKKVSYLATFLLALENLSFVQGSTAMLDVFSLTFTLAAFWLYLKERYVMSGVVVALSALAKLSGALAILVIGLHWLLTGGWTKVWHRWHLLLRFFTSHKRRWCFPLLFLCNWWLGIISFSLAILGMLALFNLGDSFGLSIIGNDQGLIGILRILGLIFLGVILMDPRQWHFLLWFLTGRRHRWRFLLWFLNRWRFLLLMLAAPITFVALMPLFDYIIWGEWLNPITQIQKMISGTGSIVFAFDTQETNSIASRPWEWLLPLWYGRIWWGHFVLPYWWTPRYLGMISPTVTVFIMPLVIYIIYRAIRGKTDALFLFAWFFGTYMVWIPASLITDRISYLFYFYPTVGAICIGMSIFIFKLLAIARERQRGKLRWFIIVVVPLYLLLHMYAFIIMAPFSIGQTTPPYIGLSFTSESIWWAIPLGLLLYIFTLFYLGIFKWRGFGDSLTPAANQVDMPPEQ